METSLQQQLIEAKEKVKTIEAAIKKQNAASIFDQVSSFEDILHLAKPCTEQLAIINYAGNNDILLCAKHCTIIALIAKVLNQGKTNNIWFPVFKRSGFVFSISSYGCSGDCTAVGSGLCFCDEKTSDFAAKTFTAEFKNWLIHQQQK